MMQQLTSNSAYSINQNYNKSNQLMENNLYISEKFIQRNNKRKPSKIKKTVSFNENVEIKFIESWKKYNTDVSYETEYAKFRNEILELKKRSLSGKSMKHDECSCIVF